jgi:hypothetical protein
MNNQIFYIILIILFYIILLQYKFDLYFKFLNGFWISDPTFCNESKINDMIFYIDNDNSIIKILIQQDNENLENTTYDSKICNLYNYNNLTICNDIIEYKLSLTEQNNENNMMNGDYILSLSLKKGIIKLYQDSIIYAILYKDNLSSNKLL